MGKRKNLNGVCFLCGALGLSIITPLQGDETYEINEFSRFIANDGATYDYFGNSVDVSGDTVVVGAYSDDVYGDNTGSAYVYRTDGSSWIETKLIPSDGGTLNDNFGYSVAVSGDTVVVGVPNDDDNGSNSGSAYIYRFDGSSWIETKLLASDGTSGDRFGESVVVSGDTIVVGAMYGSGIVGDSGSAYIYRFDGSDWNFETELLASDGATNDYFGISVSISGDGNTAIVGAYADDDNGTDSGSAYIYSLVKGIWQETKLTASDAATGDQFGNSVSISSEGTAAIVGARYNDDNGNASGSAYIYELVGGIWEETKIKASDGYANDYFGNSVAIEGTIAVIGASGNDDNFGDSGSAYMFERHENGAWDEQALLLSSEGGQNYHLGQSVGFDGNRLVSGEHNWYDSHDINTGSVCLFSLSRIIEVGGYWGVNLQEAINFYSPNYHDAITIPAGTYNESIYIDKDVNLVGLGDASDCIIDASGLLNSVVEISNASATFTNLSFTNGDSNNSGGGIAVYTGSAVLQDCKVESNEAIFGGGVFITADSFLTLIDTEVTNNWAVEGGGLYSNENALVDLIGSRIAYNDAYSGGGAVFEDSNVYIDESSFSANYAADTAGLLAVASLVDVNFTIFSGNQGKVGGGAITSQESLVFVGESGFCQNAPVDIEGYWVDEGGNTFSADCYEIDCNQNGLNDQSEIALGLALDCNLNGVPDECDLESAFSLDCNGNSIPDECDVAEGFSQDCNGNELPDECDIASGLSMDVDENGVPDECELDCNGNLVPDYFDIQEGTSMDCNANTVPDECDIEDGTEQDCDVNGIPDSCDLAGGASDLNENGVPDSCDIADGTEMDCNENAIIDSWEIANGKAQDCNENTIPDSCDYETGVLHDCDDNGVPDECKFADDPSLDCNENGILDLCDINSEVSEDLNGDLIPDECQCLADTDLSGNIDVEDLLLVIARWGQVGDPGALGDVNWDGQVDVGDLLYLISGWGPCPE